MQHHKGIDYGKGWDASHLCHNSVCTVTEHVIWEESLHNQLRKGCPVWTDFPHDHDGTKCKKRVFVCKHSPPCIKPIEGVTWQEYKSEPLSTFFCGLDDPERMWNTGMAEKDPEE